MEKKIYTSPLMECTNLEFSYMIMLGGSDDPSNSKAGGDPTAPEQAPRRVF